ncbi:MAG: hypothetical protein ACRDRT_16900, partial [Pseudonocardiaceae bacterium]
VISTDVGGCRAFVVDAELLVAAGSADALGRALIYFAKLPLDSERRLRRESRALAVSSFDIRDRYAAYCAVYDAVMCAKR